MFYSDVDPAPANRAEPFSPCFQTNLQIRGCQWLWLYNKKCQQEQGYLPALLMLKLKGAAGGIGSGIAYFVKSFCCGCTMHIVINSLMTSPPSAFPSLQSHRVECQSLNFPKR